VKQKLIYHTNCVQARGREIQDMTSENMSVTRRTFLEHVDRDSLRDVERSLSYAVHPRQGLTMAGDYHVSYHRSQYRGRPCYYFSHSAIEYIFQSPA
jgi:hypothetical protein